MLRLPDRSSLRCPVWHQRRQLQQRGGLPAGHALQGLHMRPRSERPAAHVCRLWGNCGVRRWAALTRSLFALRWNLLGSAASNPHRRHPHLRPCVPACRARAWRRRLSLAASTWCATPAPRLAGSPWPPQVREAVLRSVAACVVVVPGGFGWSAWLVCRVARPASDPSFTRKPLAPCPCMLQRSSTARSTLH